MSTATDRLYGLLPEHLRVRDAERGLPLRALVEVLAAEVDLLERNITEGLDGWFIETCQEWMVPYIGDLLRVHGLVPVPGAPFSQRAVVANTVSYRRAKGTVGVLARLAGDHTGWPAVVVEFFRTLATTQHLDHLRPHDHATCDLRATVALEQRGTAFDTLSHVADVRHIDTGRGRHSIPNLGVFLWRLQPYTMADVTAGAVGQGTRRYTFHPAGLDQPLFVAPDPKASAPPSAATEVPGTLTRELLFRELGLARSGRSTRLFPSSGEPVLRVHLDDRPVPPDRFAVCDLSAWPDMAAGSDADVGIDPQLGRMVVSPQVAAPSSVRVTHTHAFAGDLGGGSYDRDADVLPYMAGIDEVDRGSRIALVVGGTGATAGSATECATLATAVQTWNQMGGARAGVIVVRDSGTYDAPAETIEVPAGSRLLIVAADWVPEADPVQDEQRRRWGRLEASGRRPHVAGDLLVRGLGGGGDPGEVTIDGLLLSGGVAVEAGELGRLRLSHCTLVPPAGGIAVATYGPGAGGDNEELCVEVHRSILGHVRVPRIARLCLRDSIVRPVADDAIESAAPTAVDACTVFGRAAVRSLDASNSLFLEPVRAERRRVGCVRFCYLEPGSVVPRRYRCLPTGGGDRTRPRFTSTRYPQPGFAQLAWDAPEAIRRGADDGDEPGAFHFLRATARLDNLRRSLDEYLRFGLEAGVLFAT